MTCRVIFFIPFLAVSGHETWNIKNTHLKKGRGSRKSFLFPDPLPPYWIFRNFFSFFNPFLSHNAGSRISESLVSLNYTYFLYLSKGEFINKGRHNDYIVTAMHSPKEAAP